MVEEQRRRVQDHITQMIEELDRSHLRKMQADMHRCAAACCENNSYSMEKVQDCMGNCSTVINKAQQYVQGEIERIQNRLQRCVMDCNDKIKDQMAPNPTQSQVDRYSAEFDTCAIKCVDTYCAMLPALEKTMKKVLESKKFE